jgi:regulator of RNase E activity RraB
MQRPSEPSIREFPAQEWIAYLAGRNGRIVSVRVNGAFRQEHPSGLGSLVCLKLALHSPREDGLAKPEESQRLSEIDRRLEEAAGHAGSAFVGRLTADGIRTYFFYTADAALMESVSGKALAAFPDYESQWERQEDAAWTVYRDTLLPTPAEYQRSKNFEVLQALRRQGDELQQSREVRHYLYFRSASSRQEFAAWALQQGFTAQDLIEQPQFPGSFGLQIARPDRVDPDSIDALSLDLLERAEAQDAEYDGWEAEVLPARRKGLLGWLRRV